MDEEKERFERLIKATDDILAKLRPTLTEIYAKAKAEELVKPAVLIEYTTGFALLCPLETFGSIAVVLAMCQPVLMLNPGSGDGELKTIDSSRMFQLIDLEDYTSEQLH